MRVVAVIVLGCVVAVGVGGCAKRSGSDATKAQSAYPPPPANSPLAKIHEGMTELDVSSILGPPDSSKAYITGKAFIPWYFGPDQSRFVGYYKGKGRVIFSGGNQWGAGRGRVQRVEYDPSEPGYGR